MQVFTLWGHRAATSRRPKRHPQRKLSLTTRRVADYVSYLGYHIQLLKTNEEVTRLSSLHVRDPQLITDLSPIKEELHTAMT